MASYHPVLLEVTPGLRSEIEHILSPQDGIVETRIETLDTAVRDAGYWATFGAEIEYQFVDNPAAETMPSMSVDDLHEEVVVQAILGDIRSPTYDKGEMINPILHRDLLMLTTDHFGDYTQDQHGSEISETKTAPDGALEALERYWSR